MNVRLGDRVDMKLHTITTIGLQTTITATTSLDRGRKRRKKRRGKIRRGMKELRLRKGSEGKKEKKKGKREKGYQEA